MNDVRVDGDGYAFAHKRRGNHRPDLDYVGYDLDVLRQSYRERIAIAGVEGAAAEQLYGSLDAALTAYTYLAEESR